MPSVKTVKEAAEEIVFRWRNNREITERLIEKLERGLKERKYKSVKHEKPEVDLDASGTIRCLRCKDYFESWDKIKNRICKSCHSVIERLGSSID